MPPRTTSTIWVRPSGISSNLVSRLAPASALPPAREIKDCSVMAVAPGANSKMPGIWTVPVMATVWQFFISNVIL